MDAHSATTFSPLKHPFYAGFKALLNRIQPSKALLNPRKIFVSPAHAAVTFFRRRSRLGGPQALNGGQAAEALPNQSSSPFHQISVATDKRLLLPPRFSGSKSRASSRFQMLWP